MSSVTCEWCQSGNYRKIGIRKLVGRLKQIYYCKDCKSKFTGNYVPGQLDPMVSSGEKKTYPQNWPAYNASQTQEKRMFMQILGEITEKFSVERNKSGRPKIDLSDIVFSCCMKIYTGYSGRRLNSDLEMAQVQGYLKKIPHFNTLLDSFGRKEITPALQQVLRYAGFPLREVESKFAVDSTGFSTSLFSRWVDKRFGKDKTERIWVKAHAMIGTKTNIITSIEITEGHAADSPYFVPLVESSAKDFTLKEISADKAYSSRKNLEAAIDNGAIPFIPFRNNSRSKAGGSHVWSSAYRYYINHQEEFYQKYHLRSNVESTFSMLKRKFGNNLKTKTFTGQVNEILCKAICHNIVVLIHETNELGVNPALIWGENDIFKAAATLWETMKPLNVQEANLPEKGVQNPKI